MFVVMHDNHISTSQQKYRFLWTSKNICRDAFYIIAKSFMHGGHLGLVHIGVVFLKYAK